MLDTDMKLWNCYQPHSVHWRNTSYLHMDLVMLKKKNNKRMVQFLCYVAVLLDNYWLPICWVTWYWMNLLHLPWWSTLMLDFVVQDRFLSSHSLTYVLPSLPQTCLVVGGHVGHWHEALKFLSTTQRALKEHVNWSHGSTDEKINQKLQSVQVTYLRRFLIIIQYTYCICLDEESWC
jgi:hypothetical protein